METNSHKLWKITSFGNENIPIYLGCETIMILTHPKCFLIKGLGMGIKGLEMNFFFSIFWYQNFGNFPT
jgi:hypothetical protein